MKKIFVISLILLIVSGTFAQQPGKRESRYGFEVYYRPPVYYDFYLLFNQDGKVSQLNFDLRLQNDLLRFTNVEDQYEANYEVTIIIKKADSERAVFADSWRRDVRVSDFSRTNSKKDYQVDLKEFSVDLDRGKYRLFLEIMDSGTGKGYRNSREFEIPAQYKYSEIKLFKDADDHSGEIILGAEPPLVEFNYNQQATFEIRTTEPDSLVITSKLLRIKDENNRIVRQKMYRRYADEAILKFSEMLL